MERKNIITFQELMMGRNADFDKSKKISIFRLNPKLFEDVNKLYVSDSNHEAFRNFMSYFKNEENYKKMLASEYVVCCVAEQGLSSRFLAVLKVEGKDPKHYDDEYLHLIVSIAEGFDALNGKVIIRWGEKAQSTQAWKQDYLTNIKEVESIDYGISAVVPFLSYEKVRLTFPQLRAIFEEDDPVWRSKLESVNAIYAIIDDETGRMYIGSTYSDKEAKGGIWNRWQCYAETGGHGNNKFLMEIAANSPDYIASNFSWIILETLPLNIKNDKAVERENFYKEKFNTRKLGYNLN